MKNLWLSGSVNSGKTTVAKILSKRLKMMVVELDSLSGFVDQFMEFKDYLNLNYEIVSDIVAAYNRRGYGVIVVYPISEKRALESGLSSMFTFFTIDPGLENALKDRGERKLNDWERERITTQYQNSVHDLSFGTRIDTSVLGPEETASIIETYIS
jgi:cytidylate kinase